MSVCVTEGIKVVVRAHYAPSESRPVQGRYVFTYEVTLINEGEQAVQLLTRHWIIKDARGHIEEVRGEGVVGYTPHLEPGEEFTYESWCPLQTEYGTMRGSYGMVRPDGSTFDAEIAPFALMMPDMLN